MLSVVALSGCNLDADVRVAVDGDGGGRLDIALGADRELTAVARDAGADPLGDLAAAGRRVEGWSVDAVTDDDRRTVRLSTDFSGPEELRTVTGDLADGLAAPELTPLGPMRVEVTDGEVTLAGWVDLQVQPEVEDLGLAPLRAERLLRDALELRVVAAMPADVVRTDGTTTDARTVEWSVPAGTRVDFAVTSRRPWTLGRVVDVLVGPYGLAAVLALALLVGLLVVRWRQSPARSARMRSRSERT